MTTQNFFEGITHVAHISTDEGKKCEHCDFFVGLENFAESINHYIKEHNYKLLHVGQQTSRTSDGDIFHLTVATVGK